MFEVFLLSRQYFFLSINIGVKCFIYFTDCSTTNKSTKPPNFHAFYQKIGKYIQHRMCCFFSFFIFPLSPIYSQWHYICFIRGQIFLPKIKENFFYFHFVLCKRAFSYSKSSNNTSIRTKSKCNLFLFLSLSINNLLNLFDSYVIRLRIRNYVHMIEFPFVICHTEYFLIKWEKENIYKSVMRKCDRRT